MFVPLLGLARRAALAGVALAALLGSAGCGPANGVGIQYNGYAIQLSRGTVHPGEVDFNITNQNGQVTHQLLVVRTDVPADQLHLGSKSQVDETGLEVMARVDQVDVGQSATLKTRLLPGHYVLLCNIVGHYQLGMHADFTVAP